MWAGPTPPTHLCGGDQKTCDPPAKDQGPKDPNPDKDTMRFCTPSAIKAYEAMLDKVRAENAHLTEAALDAKLREARDEYCRRLRE